jgi:hypothetical protein
MGLLQTQILARQNFYKLWSKLLGVMMHQIQHGKNFGITLTKEEGSSQLQS